MTNLEIYCVTDKPIKFLESTGYNLVAVGKNIFPKKYIRCDKKKNIFHKEQYYSELTFHYWFWKNLLAKKKKCFMDRFLSKKKILVAK